MNFSLLGHTVFNMSPHFTINKTIIRYDIFCKKSSTSFSFPPLLLISLCLMVTAALRGAQPAELNRFLRAGRSSVSLLIISLDCLDPTKALVYADMFHGWRFPSRSRASCRAVAGSSRVPPSGHMAASWQHALHARAGLAVGQTSCQVIAASWKLGKPKSHPAPRGPTDLLPAGLP